MFRLARRVRGARFVVNVVLLLLAVALRRFFEVQHAAAGSLSSESPLTRSQPRRARATLHSAENLTILYSVMFSERQGD